MGKKSIEQKTNEIMRDLKLAAAAAGNGPLLFKVLDLEQAAKPTDEPNLTGIELAKLLGVPLNDKELPADWTEMANACLHIQSNEAVNKLPMPERIRALRTATALLDQLL